MFSAPTGIRVAEETRPAFLRNARSVVRLKHLFCGRAVDEPTHTWITQALGRP